MRPPSVDLNAVEIREMELEDLPHVFALGEKLFTAEKWPVLYRTWDEYEVTTLFDSDGEFCLVAELGGRRIGFALGTLVEKRNSAWSYGYLVWLGVDPALARSGIGVKLLSRMTDIFIRRGARMMMADTAMSNKVALRFFRKNGFKNETKHVYFTKNLTSHPVYRRHKHHEEH